MNSIPKYLIIIFIAAVVFVAGRYSKPDQGKELVRKYELERKYHQGKIDSLNRTVANLDRLGRTIAEKMHQDSLKYSVALTANKEAYNKLKRKYESINLSGANRQSLDSLVTVLYGTD